MSNTPVYVDALFVANGGYANSSKEGQGRDNAQRERMWFSPHCLDPHQQPELFGQ